MYDSSSMLRFPFRPLMNSLNNKFIFVILPYYCLNTMKLKTQNQNNSGFQVPCCSSNPTHYTHKFPRGVSHKTPHCQTPHKKGGRSVLAQLMKFLWISPKTRQLGETFEGWLWFTKPNLPTAPVDQNIWSGFWEWSRQKNTVEPRKYNFSY